MTALVLLLPLAAADPAPDLPAVRPGHFWGAIGPPITTRNGRVRVSAELSRSEVPVNDRIALTVTVVGAVNPETMGRPDLPSLPEFARDFAVENVPEVTQPATGRAFAWWLRPRSEGVTAVPSVPFVYYRSGCLPASAGFMTTDTGPPLPLTVRPATTPILAVPLAAPDSLFALAPVSARAAVPAWLTWPAAIAGPPLVCWGLFAWWRWRWPDAAARLRIRRSRAARRALARLRSATDAADCRRTILGYLSDRCGLPDPATTPAEVTVALASVGWPPDAVARAAAVLEWYDAARFGPGPIPAVDTMRVRGTEFVAEWEARPWPS